MVTVCELQVIRGLLCSQFGSLRVIDCITSHALIDLVILFSLVAGRQWTLCDGVDGGLGVVC